jgi:hypothetical protein
LFASSWKFEKEEEKDNTIVPPRILLGKEVGKEVPKGLLGFGRGWALLLFNAWGIVPHLDDAAAGMNLTIYLNVSKVPYLYTHLALTYYVNYFLPFVFCVSI